MKIYVAHSIGFDFQKELYEPLQNSDFAQKHELILPHVGSISNSKDAIKNADLIIAEVSYPSTGEGIELGWADAFGKRMIFIHKAGSKISASLDYLKGQKLEYSDSASLVSVLNSAIGF
jgi:hypothetical protein